VLTLPFQGLTRSVQAPTLQNLAAGDTSPPNANWSLIDKPADFIPYGKLFGSNGMEIWSNRDPWRACDSFTAPGVGRESCKQQATGILVDRDIPTLQALARIHQVRV
jgi:hypothetical protein